MEGDAAREKALVLSLSPSLSLFGEACHDQNIDCGRPTTTFQTHTYYL